MLPPRALPSGRLTALGATTTFRDATLPSEIQIPRRHLESDFLIRHPPAAATRRAAEKKWKSLARFDDFTRRRRLYAFLARRGFDPDEIRSVMTTLGETIEAERTR